jgi:hypothetical protein
MIVYELHVYHEEGELGGHEFFASLKAAEVRRKELIAEKRDYVEKYEVGGDYKIDRVVVASGDLTPKQLVLGVLNGRGYVKSRVAVVDEYDPTQEMDE